MSRVSWDRAIAPGFLARSALFVPELRLREPSDNLEESSVRPSLNFLSALVLYGMRYLHCVKIRTIKCSRLGARGRLQLASGDGQCGHSQILQMNRSEDARKAYEKYLELAPESKVAPVVREKLKAVSP